MLAILFAAGLIAGVIDAIAGGGGLITLPVFALVLPGGLGPEAIGTNKIAGLVAALAALGVYAKGGHLDWKRAGRFALWVGLGALAGSTASPWVPVFGFKIFLAVSCPVILWVVWNRPLWIERGAAGVSTRFRLPLEVNGLICGLYDGIWGPGGGTFMFLALFLGSGLPLLQSLAASKLANALSAGASLANFAYGGYVRWNIGMILAAGILIGSVAGAALATRNAARIVRPVLAIVAILLMVRMLLKTSVEHSGVEPLTSTMPSWRSTN